MPASNDTFSSKKTTPFQRRDAFDSGTTTPFERRTERHEIALDVDAPDRVSLEQETAPQGAIPWLFVAVCLGAVVGAAIWAARIGF